MIPNPEIDPMAELATSILLGQKLANQARADLVEAMPILIEAIRHGSGQSAKLTRILWSCWNDDHSVNLCDSLAGLDARLVQAAVTMIAARAHLGGDADDLLRAIIDGSGTQPPPKTNNLIKTAALHDRP
jgi:hypothetical protein